LPPNAPLAGALRQSSAWRLTYDDGVALIFRPERPASSLLQQAAAGAAGGRSQSVTADRKDKPL